MSTTVLLTIVILSVIVMMLGFLFEGIDTKYSYTLGPIFRTVGTVIMALITILLIIEVIGMLFGVSIFLA